MNIGIDLDGTAWKYKELFVLITRGLKNQGIKIGIVTAHRGLIEADINLWRNRGFPEPDFYYSRDGDTSNLGTREWKEYICRKNGVDYLFDDFDTEDIRVVGL